MAQVKTLVITGYGTNCERECAFAADQAGSDQTTIVYFSDLTADKVSLADYNFLILPGGFLDGDDLGSAQAAALRWRHMKTASGKSLMEELKRFLDAGGLILGICNGFQLLVKLGLLPALDGAYFTRQVSLSHNDSAKYEDRWVTLKINACSPRASTISTSPCVTARASSCQATRRPCSACGNRISSPCSTWTLRPRT